MALYFGDVSHQNGSCNMSIYCASQVSSASIACPNRLVNQILSQVTSNNRIKVISFWGTSPATIVLSKGKGSPKPWSMAHGSNPDNKRKPAPEAIARGFTPTTSSETKAGWAVSCGTPPGPPRSETTNPNRQKLPI